MKAAVVNPRRRLKEHVLEVWRAIAARGPSGATLTELQQQLCNAQRSKHDLRNCIASMQTGRYLRFAGEHHTGSWIAAEVPVGEPVPDWQRTSEMPRRPSSVFALAAAPVPSDWTIKGRRTAPPPEAKLVEDAGVDIDAVHQRTVSAAEAKPLGWVAPPAEQCKPEAEAEPQKPSDPGPAMASIVVGMAGSAGITGQAAVPVVPITTHTPPPPYLPPEKDPLYAPHFALHSDGTFEIHVDASLDGIVLQPDTTRALFRWLDRLGGTHLSRIAEGT